MEAIIQELLDLGFTPTCAATVCVCYLANHDMDGLFAFIDNVKKDKQDRVAAKESILRILDEDE